MSLLARLIRTGTFAMTATFIAMSSSAHAVDISMGSVKLAVDPASTQCALSMSNPSDKRLSDLITGSVNASGNDLLLMTADCKELPDWRAGQQKYLKRFMQYQTATTRRGSAYGIQEAKNDCEQLPKTAQDDSTAAMSSTNDYWRKINSRITADGQSFLGILGQDADGCYVGLSQRYTADDGTPTKQISVFYMGTVKNRALYVYLFVPLVDDDTVKATFETLKPHVDKIKAANRIGR